MLRWCAETKVHTEGIGLYNDVYVVVRTDFKRKLKCLFCVKALVSTYFIHSFVVVEEVVFI